MSAAALQGVPVMTLDTDIWVELPPRQYMRTINLSIKLGAAMRANTVVELEDGHLVNFLYHVDGINGFKYEFSRANKIDWMGLEIRVLPLKRILKSKETILRDKDLAHIIVIKKILETQEKEVKQKKRRKKR